MQNFPIDLVDLCAGEVRVTAPGLKKLAQIAAGRSRWDCESHLREIQETQWDSGDCHRNGIHAYHAAAQLKEAAADLEISLRFLNAFNSLAKGERQEIVLKPQRV